MSERRSGVLIVDRDPLSVRMLKEPHILIAGTTGSGKSTMLNTLLYTLASFPLSEIGYNIIDLKRVSLLKWKNDPHLERYATTPEDAMQLLKDFEYTMQCRFEEIEKANQDRFDGGALYLIIDEAAELFDTVRGAKEIVKSIARLGRAANCHLVLCTQSPNRKTIPADVTLNFTACLALRCKSAIESRQVIGYKGAENLPRYGTGLYVSPDTMNPEEVKVNLTPDSEIDILLNEWENVKRLQEIRRQLNI